MHGIKINPKPKRMTVIVPSTVNAVIRLRAEKHKVKPYYLVSAALGAFTGLCCVCGAQLTDADLDPERDILFRCDACLALGKVPDRVLAKKDE